MQPQHSSLTARVMQIQAMLNDLSKPTTIGTGFKVMEMRGICFAPSGAIEGQFKGWGTNQEFRKHDLVFCIPYSAASRTQHPQAQYFYKKVLTVMQVFPEPWLQKVTHIKRLDFPISGTWPFFIGFDVRLVPNCPYPWPRLEAVALRRLNVHRPYGRLDLF